MRAMLLNVLALALVAASACRRPGEPADTVAVRVAAASDLAPAFEAMAPHFAEETGHRLDFSFGSSGLLAQQLRSGAPFDLFVAANVAFVESAVATGTCDGATTVTYARGRLAVWSPANGVPPPSSLEELGDARFRRVAIAQPEHAPYGRAAEEALRAVGLWDDLQPRLVHGENVRQAWQFAASRNAEAAVVALALVAKDRTNPWILVDPALHAPIEQAMAVCVRGANRAGGEAFARFLASSVARRIMSEHGFELPQPEGASTP